MLNAITVFITNIFIVRFMTQDAYGVLTFSMNAYLMVSLFIAFGLLSGMLQFCAEKRSDKEKKEIYWYTLQRGFLISCFMCIGIVATGVFVEFPLPDSGLYFSLFGPMLILDFLFQYAILVLRSKKHAKEFAYLQVIKSLAYFLFGCAGAYLAGILGTIIGRYLAFFCGLSFSIFFLKHNGFFPAKVSMPSNELRRELWAYSVPLLFASCINQLTFMLDVFLLGCLLENAADVALYQVATIIPEGLSFIPGSIVVTIVPYFVENNKNYHWFRQKTKELLVLSIGVFLIITIVLIVLAPYIILLLWGREYIGAQFAFQILACCFTLNAIRSLCTNLLATLREVKANLVISAISLVINVILCFVLIPNFGIVGAAFSPTIVSLVAAIISTSLLIRGILKIRKKNDEQLS